MFSTYDVIMVCCCHKLVVKGSSLCDDDVGLCCIFIEKMSGQKRNMYVFIYIRVFEKLQHVFCVFQKEKKNNTYHKSI